MEYSCLSLPTTPQKKAPSLFKISWSPLLKNIQLSYDTLLLPVVLVIVSFHTSWTIKAMSSTLVSALTSLRENNYVTRMFILTFEKSISRRYHSCYDYCHRI